MEGGVEYREAWLGVGEASEALRDAATAEQSFRKAVAYFPDRVEPHYRLAQLLKKEDRSEEASKEFALVTKLQEQDRARAAAIISSSRVTGQHRPE